MLSGFPVWLLGTCLALMPAPPSFGNGWRWASTVVYVLLFFGLGPADVVPNGYGDFVLGILTLGFLWVLLSARSRAAENAVPVQATRTLARFSYTLYVVHTPVLVLIAALISRPIRWQPTAPHLLTGFGILLLVVAFCICVAKVTEFRTDILRRGIESRLGLSVSSA